MKRSHRSAPESEIWTVTFAMSLVKSVRFGSADIRAVLYEKSI